MAAPINRRQDIAGGETGAQAPIQLNRYAQPDVSFFVDPASTITATIEVSPDYISRDTGVTPTWYTVQDDTGAADLTITDKSSQVIPNTPFEAIRINPTVNGTGFVFHVLQNG